MKKITFILSLTIFFFACGNENNTDEREAKPLTQEEFLVEIKAMEKSLFSSMTMNKDSAEKMIALYNDYARNFPEAKEAPDYLYKAADVAGSLNKPKIKVENYKTILEKYPDWSGSGQVHYLLAFTLDAELNQREEAKKYYLDVIANGKDTNFVRDSRYRMTTIDSLTYDEFIDFIIKDTEPIMPVQ